MKEAGRHGSADDLLRPFLASVDRAGSFHERELVERPDPGGARRSPILECRVRRKAEAAVVTDLEEVDDAVGMSIGKSAHEDTVDDAEDRRRRADA